MPDESLSINRLKIISHFISEKLFVMQNKHINQPDLEQVRHQKLFRPRELNLLTIPWCCGVFMVQHFWR